MSIKRGLGRGLDALFIENEANFALSDKTLININDVEPNKDQPRKIFDEESLIELAESIKQHGVIQPIIVKLLENGRYMIIAGERRWRASRIAGLKQVPVVVRDVDKKSMMQLAMIENLQRENLNAIEESKGYKKLMDEYHLTQEEVAKSVGKPRSVVANSLRLLNLPEIAVTAISDGKISKGHGKVLLSLNDSARVKTLLKEVLNKNLSVRQLEEIALKNDVKKIDKQKVEIEKDVFYKEAEISLSQHLSTQVNINKKGKGYRLEIDFYEKEELETLINHICG